ncbi:hypothetical protein [Horticoccus sp. 23ND18S-11]|uniref:hypothetical protein n=1 Tax=Horticoccus sp. 23ND18S-11 TaxID=3391832 RepID=UPI0039C8E4EC
MKRLALASALLVLLMSSVSTAATATKGPGSAPVVQRIARPAAAGVAASVRVPDGALVFTGQVFPSTLAGDVHAHAASALAATKAAVVAAGGDPARLVRLNAYAPDDAAVAPIEALIAQQFAAVPVAFSFVRTPLAVAGTRVAFEAVAQSSRPAASVEIVTGAGATLPAGGKIFISGQAERGTDLASAVKLTMAGLHRSVAHLGLKKSDIVQVKSFIQPFGDHATAQREIAASFDGGPVPPSVIMEWVSDLYAEIEIVVSARALPSRPEEPVTFSWLPWLTKSPRYCNVAHVAPGTPLIFIGAIDGGDANDPRTQMKVIFERLGSVLFEAGSSYRNMAKATYYLADPTARSLLGDVRGVYYDPARPPAASALNMTGLGYPKRAAMVDMIAVPVK